VASEEALLETRMRCERFSGWFKEQSVVRDCTLNGVATEEGSWARACAPTSTCTSRSTVPLRVVKDPDPALTTLRTGRYNE
jgi:hypothetical protein